MGKNKGLTRLKGLTKTSGGAHLQIPFLSVIKKLSRWLIIDHRHASDVEMILSDQLLGNKEKKTYLYRGLKHFIEKLLDLFAFKSYRRNN